MAILLITVPLVAAGLAVCTPWDRWRPWLLPAACLAHGILTVTAIRGSPVSAWNDWLVLDPLGKMFLGLASTLFLICSLYTAPYLTRAADRPNRIFCACFLLSLSMITLVTLSHHLGLMWVGMEATTLAMAPNICFHRTPRSLEATWKYLVICSAGIALALLGSFFLAYSTLHAGFGSTLLFDDLVRHAPQLSRPWSHAAFVLVLVGYGTKMGLAPMHTWLPDAHGEAPAPVSALLSGALLPCAFLAILRVFHICNATGDGELDRSILIGVGSFSMAVAAVFMADQRDLKRLLAYSSVEHMGILAIGVGIGGPAVFGALLHVINNGLTKVSLFLSAGNLQDAYQSRSSNEVRGAIRRLPLTGPLFLAAFLAITGSPPFGPFVSEFTILNAALGSGRYLLAALFLFLMGAVFVGMGATIIPVVLGTPPVRAGRLEFRERALGTAPIVVSMGVVLLLGLYLPAPLESLLREASEFLEPSG